MTKRPSLRASVPSPPTAAVRAAAHVRELQRRQDAREGTGSRPMTTSTVHMPVELLEGAANRRAGRKMREDPKGRGGRPSVSEIVAKLLEQHRDEIDRAE
ncbi:MAG: hypothetical protein ACREFU_12165 [Acetobacteraceae bacterium]